MRALEPFGFALRIPRLENDVPAFDVAELAQALANRQCSPEVSMPIRYTFSDDCAEPSRGMASRRPSTSPDTGNAARNARANRHTSGPYIVDDLARGAGLQEVAGSLDCNLPTSSRNISQTSQ